MTELSDNRRKFNEALKDYYMEPLAAHLNDHIFYSIGPPMPAQWYLDQGLPLPWVYVRPPWHKRIQNKFKNRVWDVRIRIASKIAGHDVLDHDDW